MIEQQFPVIAIDGPSGVGKGMLSNALAEHLNWHRLESGVLYRSLALLSLEQSVKSDDNERLAELAENLNLHFTDNGIQLGSRDISRLLRTSDVEKRASIVARSAPARTRLMQFQLRCRRAPGLVAEGRDMGTVVFPDAILKVFLQASSEARVLRRWKQLKEIGNNAKIGKLLQQLKQRDESDINRSLSPLVPADDAIVIDTTNLSPETVVKKVVLLWEKNRNK